MDWDEVRYFLAVARGGSARAAADTLAVNHSTVVRRLALLERKLGAMLFEKLPTGYRLTAAGKDIVSSAEEMEAASNRLEARVQGRDQGVKGRLRATMAPVLAAHLLMPDLVEFAQLYPDVEMQITPSDQPVNLTNREADVALRLVYDRHALPRQLHGLQGPEAFMGVYLSRRRLAAFRKDGSEKLRWIIKDRYGHPAWSQQTDLPVSDVLFRTTDAGAQMAAVREGLGLTLLPCFVGDADPLLVRAPGSRIAPGGTLWLLTERETRRSTRVRLFTQFLARKLAGHAPLLAGQLPSFG